jgi:hypothetical protein
MQTVLLITKLTFKSTEKQHYCPPAPGPPGPSVQAAMQPLARAAVQITFPGETFFNYN